MTEISETKSPAREEAEVAKILLEAEKLKADIESVKIEQRLKEAEARKATALATEAEHDAEMRKIRLEENKRGEALVAVTDFYKFVHVFDQPVSRISVNNCLNTLNAWHRLHPNSEWEIVMDSPGGDVVSGMHLFDEIAGHSKRGGGTHEITMTVRGYAASMAGILLQAVDHRVMGKRASLLIHPISSWAEGSLGAIEDRVKWLNMLSSQVKDLFVERSEGKITAERFEDGWSRKDWWLSSSESLELGFCDRIG